MPVGLVPLGWGAVDLQATSPPEGREGARRAVRKISAELGGLRAVPVEVLSGARACVRVRLERVQQPGDQRLQQWTQNSQL